MADDVEERYILRGMQVGVDFERDPTRQVALLGAFLLKQEDTIKQLMNTVRDLSERDTISSDQLSNKLSPMKNNIRSTKSLVERTRSSLYKSKSEYFSMKKGQFSTSSSQKKK